MKRAIVIVCWMLCCAPWRIYAQEDSTKVPWLEIRGYIKYLQGISFADSIGSLSTVNLLHHRINAKARLTQRLTGRLELRNRIFFGEQVKQVPGFGQRIDQYNGWFDLSALWVDEQPLVVHSVIDRLYLQYTSPRWDIRAGRQRINWGINNIWNPNDIFNAYNFLDFDYEERPGNDALRIRHFAKNQTTLEAAYRPGKNRLDHTGALLYTFQWKRYDFQVLGGLDRTDLVAGAGWAGHIRSAGFKGEWSYFQPWDLTTDSTGVFTLSLMADQTFSGGWYLTLAGLYISRPGSDGGGSSGNIFGGNLSAKNLFPYPLTFLVGLMKPLSPITFINVSILYAPENHATILFPAIGWNAAPYFDLDLTAQSFWESRESRFRNLGNAIFLRGKWSY